MMAMFYAQRIIMEKTTFAKVPEKLREAVATILVSECGLPQLVSIGYGGTLENENA